MPFNAGDIEATLQLDRTPFNRGLDQARDAAKKLAAEKFELKFGADMTAAEMSLEFFKDDAEKTAISLEAQVSTLAAGAHLAGFRREQEENPVDMDADVSTFAASEHLDSWRAEQGANDIELEVDADTGAAQGEMAALRMSAIGAGGGVSFLMAAIIPLGAVAIPILAATAGAVAGIAFAAGGALLGVGALAAVVVPSLQNISKATKAQADADKQLAEAQKAVESATTTAQKASAHKKLEEAYKAQSAAANMLTASEKQLQSAMNNAKASFTTFYKEMQPAVLPAVAKAINLLPPILNALKPLVTAVGESLGYAMDMLTAATPYWTAFFEALAPDAADSLHVLIAILQNLAQGFAGLMLAFQPLGGSMLEKIEELTSRFAVWANTLKDTQGFKDFMGYIATNGPKVWDMLVSIAQAGINIIKALAPLGGPTLAAFQGIAAALASIDPTLLGAMLTALGTLLITIKALTLATLVWNAVTNANPIAIIVLAVMALVAAFIYLWQNSAGFRDFFIGLWEGIKNVVGAVVDALVVAFNAVLDALRAVGDAFVWVYQVLIKPQIDAWILIGRAVWSALVAAFDGIMVAVRAVGDAFQWVWEVILKPVFEAISLAARVLFAVIFTVLVGPLIILWKTVLAPLFTWLWESIIQPIFKLISAAFFLIYHGVIKPIVDGIKVVIDNWGFIMSWLYDVIIKPVFDKIAKIFNWIGDNVIKPLADYFKFQMKVAGDAIQWLHDNVIDPVSKAIGVALNWVKDNVVKPLGDYFDFQIKKMGEIFSWLHANVIKPVGEAIGSVFNWLWTSVMKPVIDGIVSAWDGLGKAFQWVWDNVLHPVINFFVDVARGLQEQFRIAVDNIGVAWEGVKAVFAKPINFVINTILNDGLFAAWNWIADKIGLSDMKLHVNPIAGYAEGGIVGAYAGGGVLPGYSPGVDNLLGLTSLGPIALSGGEAIMRPEWTAAAGSGYVNAANAAAAQGGIAGAQTFINNNGLPGYAHGGIAGASPSVGGLPGFFLGGAFDWIGDAAGKVGNALGGAAKWVGGKVSDIAGFVTDPVGSVKKLFDGVINGASGLAGGTDLGKMLLQLPKKAATGLIDKVKSWFDAGAGAQFGPSNGSPNGNGGLGPMAAAARQFVMQQWGLTNIGGYANRNIAGTGTVSDHALGKAIDVMIPNYQSPPSIALGNDIANWFVGNPARFGTKYVIWRDRINDGGGWEPYGHPGGGRSDTLQHRDHVHVSVFNKGGIFGGGGGAASSGISSALQHGTFDQGGILRPGYTLAYNGTGKNETIRTNEQEKALAKPGGPMIENLNVYAGSNASAGDIIDAALFKVRHAGKGVHG